MVVVFLHGGLGNQMFQYAAGRQLAINQSSVLKLDLSWFDGDASRRGFTPRRFLLRHFEIEAGECTAADVYRLRLKSEWRRVSSAVRRVPVAGNQECWLVERQHFAFDPRILQARGDVYLHGYWQNEKYFTNCQARLREEFQLKEPLHPGTDDILNRIASTNSVAIHVRRGDYLEQAEAPRSHRVCDAGYYRECIGRMVDRVSDPHFFIFSDDPAWAARNLSIPGDAPSELVTHNRDDRAYEDLFLISSCRHQIISNSTFGWWGAWLNNNPDKVVIGPDRWFRGDVFKTSELLPPGWERV